ncbi:MAG: cytochrome b/b6 domain-containing protein [Pseudomonadota bacterium]
MKYGPMTRILHLLVAAGVTSQMLTSLVMVHPKPGRLPDGWYGVHETVGIGLLAVVSAYWLWILGRTLSRGEPLMLFPWLSGKRLAALRDDTVETGRAALGLRLPAGDEPQPLPAAIQGIGLLLALLLAATGTAIELGMAPDGGPSPLLRGVKEVHESMAPLMWAYLVAHPLLSLLHQLAGHRTLSRMFGLG